MYSPFLVQLVVTRRCNLKCAYCNEYDNESPPVPLEILKKRLVKLKELNAFAVEFTGGEPLLHPDIVELVRFAKQDLRFFKLMMISNAFLLDEEKIKGLNDAGLQEIQISVDGVQSNEQTKKVLNKLKKKLELLERFAEFKVVISSVIGSAPHDEVLEVVHFAKEHGFIPRVLVLHDDDGQVKLKKEDLAVYHNIGQILGRRRVNPRDYLTELALRGEAPFKCRAGSRYIYVDENGIACWCSQTRGDFSIPLSQYTPALLKKQFNTQKSCNIHCTIGCVRTCSRYDEWRPQRLRSL